MNKYFKLPFKSLFKKNKTRKSSAKTIYKNSEIPFDPKSQLKYKELFSKNK